MTCTIHATGMGEYSPRVDFMDIIEEETECSCGIQRCVITHL